MLVKKAINKEAQLAKEYALNTHRSFFLTGRAGTGKTTFLHKLLATIKKKTIVLAPTGVAAINAGGSTIHSMFGFTLKIFVPSHEFTDANIAVNKPLLIKHLRYNDEKRKLFRELELLVIDEVSMVRADLLDAIDFTLKYIRQNKEPFGGVQVLAIGDLFQLAPIINSEEWQLLKNHYNHPYFFEAHAWQDVDPLIIELEKVYRQEDDHFIHILNNIRSGHAEHSDLEKLNRLYQPHFEDTQNEYITLTTHNYKADKINRSELKKIDQPLFSYQAEIEGNFNESSFPVDEELSLKVGAQVMFTRNDVEEGRYFNGKIGVVSSLKEEEVWINCPDEDELIQLQQVKWENKKYTLDKDTNDIQQKTLGSFSQYPLRLAWAVTIHKSQGLTFDKAVIDVGDAFASGQTYVALSRCRKIEGIVLKSKLRPASIKTDHRVVSYLDRKTAIEELSEKLASSKKEYAQLQLIRLFKFNGIAKEIEDWQKQILDKNLPNKEKCIKLGRNLHKQIQGILRTQMQYQQYLKTRFSSLGDAEDSGEILKKCEKAISYFTERLYKDLISPLHAHAEEMAYKKNSKKHVRNTKEVIQYLWANIHQLYEAKYLNTSIYNKDKKYTPDILPKIKASTGKKGSTYDNTLELYQQGKSVEEIAKARALKETTIHGHLSRWVEKGKVAVKDVMDIGKLEQLLPYFEDAEFDKLTEIKNSIPFDTDFIELKYARAYFQREKANR